MKYISIIVIVVAILSIISNNTAGAKTITKVDCKRYAAMHVFVTGNESVRVQSTLSCYKKAHDLLLSTPLPDSEVPPVLRAIRGCESGSGAYTKPNYTAQNQNSTASGGYQYLDSTWGNHLGYARAMLAPARVQDLRAIRDYNKYGTSPWEASRGCWG